MLSLSSACPGDDPASVAPLRPDDIIRRAKKQAGVMGFLRPLTDAKEQRDLAKVKVDCAAKQVADAEASKKAAATKRPQRRPRKLVPAPVALAWSTQRCNSES